MTTLPKTDEIRLVLSDGWLTVWLDRPAARNALTAKMVAELTATLEGIRHDRSLRGVTLRGAGGVFCAGGDLKAFRDIFQGESGSAAEIAAASRDIGVLLDALNRSPQPLVILVEGAAMAGGLGMLCTADVAIATADSEFALTETTLGIPPAQIAPFVVQRLGLAATRRLTLTGARFDGASAQSLGLVDFVATDTAHLEQIEQDVRRQVMNCAPGANAATKGLLLEAAATSPSELRDHAATVFATSVLGAEAREGIAAFIEKRKPDWSA